MKSEKYLESQLAGLENGWPAWVTRWIAVSEVRNIRRKSRFGMRERW